MFLSNVDTVADFVLEPLFKHFKTLRLRPTEKKKTGFWSSTSRGLPHKI